MSNKFEYVPHMGVYIRWGHDGRSALEVMSPPPVGVPDMVIVHYVQTGELTVYSPREPVHGG